MSAGINFGLQDRAHFMALAREVKICMAIVQISPRLTLRIEKTFAFVESTCVKVVVEVERSTHPVPKPVATASR